MQQQSPENKMEELQRTLSGRGYNLMGPIGAGGTAKCFIVQSTQYKTQFVCKVVENVGKLTSSYYSEVNALVEIIHPNIIKIYEFFAENSKLFLILEYCQKGSMDKVLANEKLSPLELKCWVKQLAEALVYCHSMNLAHHDIKPANLFLDEYNRIKLADFGLSQSAFTGDLSQKYSGSIPYMAPEIFEKKPYDPFKADVWSFGVTVFQMATGRLPFIATTIPLLVQLMRTEHYTIGADVSRDILAVIRCCLNVNPLKRPSMKDIVQMIFVENAKTMRVLPQVRRRPKITKTLSFSSLGFRIGTSSSLKVSFTYGTIPPILTK